MTVPEKVGPTGDMQAGDDAAQPALTGKLLPEVQQLVDRLVAQGFPGWKSLGVEGNRAIYAQLKALAGPPEPVQRVEDVTIPVGEHRIGARVYIPSLGSLPVFVYLHGGGWVGGNLDAFDSPVRALANRSGAAIVSIDYRLAPEHRYPAALEDALGALRWAVGPGAETYDWDPGRLGIGGDSAGANISAAVSLMLRDQGKGPHIDFNLLINPCVDHDYTNTSYRRFGNEGVLTLADVEFFTDLYLANPEQRRVPYAAPLRATSLAGMPRTYLATAEIDPLFDEQVEYARRLKESGVSVNQRVFEGMCHGFVMLGGVIPQAAAALEEIGLAIRHGLSARHSGTQI